MSQVPNPSGEDIPKNSVAARTHGEGLAALAYTQDSLLWAAREMLADHRYPSDSISAKSARCRVKLDALAFQEPVPVTASIQIDARTLTKSKVSVQLNRRG
jgi:hypothetical protein